MSARPGGLQEQYALLLPGAVLLSSRAALLDTAQGMQVVEREGARNGLASTARRQELLRFCLLALQDLDSPDGAASAPGSAEVPQRVGVSGSDAGDLVDVEQAAAALGVSTRQTRNLAGALGGRKVGRRWWFEWTAVQELAASRPRHGNEET